MVIFAISLAVGLGLYLVPEAVQHLGKTAQILLTSGLLPAAFIAIFLNYVLPQDMDVVGENLSAETSLSGLGNVGDATAGMATGAAGVAAAGAVGLASTAGSTASTATAAVPGVASAGAISGGAGDDIELIDGIGPKIGASLKAQGLMVLSQIAAMPDADIAALAKAIGVPEGQPARQEWKIQAQEMLSGSAPRAAIDRNRK